MAVILKFTFLLVALILLSDFIFAVKFIHIVLSPSAKRPKPSAEKLSECLEDEILVTEQEPKCYSKVHQLFQECERNQQCMPSNSYCGFSYNESEDLEQLMCLCVEGLKNSQDNTTCGIACEESMQFDSIKNVTQLSNDCPSPSQVCRQGICFCPTGFSINRNGDCVEIPAAQEQTKLYSPTESSNALNNAGNPPPVHNGSTSWIIFVAIGTAAILIVSGIGFAIFYMKKKNNSKASNASSAEDRELEVLKVSE